MAELAAKDRTFPRMLELQASKFSSKLLVQWKGGTRTYAETLDAVAHFAGKLEEAGVGPGDRVTVMCGNRIEMLDCFLACGWLGAVFVPVNVALRGPQLGHVLQNADPKLLIVEPELVEHIKTLSLDVPSLEHIWITDTATGSWLGVEIVPLPTTRPRRHDAHPAHPSDCVAILYTSGTTGASKGVMCPHAQFYWWGTLMGRDLELTERDVLYTVLPMFHINALHSFWQALLAGGTFAFGERFSASRFWDEILEGRASVSYLLGAMVQILLKQDPKASEREHSLRIVHAPGTSKEAVEAFFNRYRVRLLDGYGSTETNHVFSNGRPYTPGFMGRPFPEFEVRVVDKDDNDVEPETTGELLIRPRKPFSISSGYFRMPEATIEAWRNLWFHTGDLVACSQEGVWQFVDRRKDAIRRRGENISSVEVEEALESHADIVSAAVVPVPSDLGDDDVMAFVVLRPGAASDPAAIVRYCEPRLAYFAIPRYVEFVDELPLTENRKVQKAALRNRGVGPTTWDRERAGINLGR